MRAAVIDRFGGPRELHLAELEDPPLGPGQVRIRVIAAAVGKTDAITRAGEMIRVEEARFPMVLGWDAAGVVEELGADVDSVSAGDRVMAFSSQALTQVGTYAEQLVVAADAVAPAPIGVDLEQACTLPLSALTAVQALDAVGFTAGQTLLIIGATGAVGRFACQLAAGRGGTVIAVVRESNAGEARLLGAQHVVTPGEDLPGRLVGQLGGLVDAALNLANSRLNALAQATVRDCGKFATIVGGLPAPARGIGAQRVRVRADPGRLLEMAGLMSAGVLTVRLAEVVPLSQAARAHTLLDSDATRGRIVLGMR
jgi:NADPH:quinone reductase